MPLYSFHGDQPEIGEGSFIAPSADVIGKVKIGKNASLWYNVVARGDINRIEIGDNTNVQDLTMLHVDFDLPCLIGKNVTIGHNAIIHACTVGDHCLIGMGAIILNGAVIGENSVVAAGSVVPPGKSFPSNSMIMGSPAKVVRELTPEERNKYGQHFQSYIKAKDRFLSAEGLKRID
ncbi:MAG: gamma carbonic anhydrase family protein [Bdellovibrio sp. CG12_big_fil_rev_8_21_14_0_65_39_13]|nr:MAG: gamma carbonic anhydrase family protein [Bdellovibrio sp. CG22_combo_CG10-13_8_21_14_all_39_27]PIQ58066.1 MAG: gamma carbonic anhydrase family protein [Bdellovibrio sp. CG12_big_fil_rev_8_21_14_0_65_39_13]PIR32942.1 MAG: gamma carbonic anhydrase family protein [Bdellovibrio sp. CG11_big_fil_rev_8_21_14_0_20_39_38]PJB54439.1 MAG: gamma carbonic anhydrase family protein [Bdellovibrio sp. CG_4_9_14_3_um_filter_39_7]